MTNNCGIYSITNTLNGDFYIGSSCNIGHRLAEHRWTLVKNTHHNRHLQRAWNKYGADNFEFTVVLLCDKEHNLTEEQTLLDLLKPAYNIAKDALAPMQGLHPSDEARRHMSEAGKVKCFSEKHKHNLSEAGKGNTNALGCKRSEETKLKISGENNHNFGKVVSAETRHNMSEAHKGKPSAFLGKQHTDETKRKISETQKRRRAEKKCGVGVTEMVTQ